MIYRKYLSVDSDLYPSSKRYHRNHTKPSSNLIIRFYKDKKRSKHFPQKYIVLITNSHVFPTPLSLNTVCLSLNMLKAFSVHVLAFLILRAKCIYLGYLKGVCQTCACCICCGNRTTQGSTNICKVLLYKYQCCLLHQLVQNLIQNNM